MSLLIKQLDCIDDRSRSHKERARTITPTNVTAAAHVALISLHSTNEKISNKSSFGIIDIAESSTSDRIIVIVKMACFIDDGAYRCRSGRHVNVSGSH